MKMDLSNFHKIKEDEHSAVLRHPEGHHIVLDKSKLHPKMKQSLSSLPMHFAGDSEDPADSQVPDPSQPTIVINNHPPEEYDPKQAAMMLLKDPKTPESVKQKIAADNGIPQTFDMMGNPTPFSESVPQEETRQPVAQPAPVQEAPVVQQAPQAASPVSSPDQMLGQYQGAMKQYGQGLSGEAEAIGKRGQEESAIYHKAAEEQQNILSQHQQLAQKMQEEYDNLVHDARNQHIDPKRLYSNMGVGQKIATGIGLLLGGFDPAGHGNAMVSLLNKTVENDIEAQKADMDKNQNLLSANYRQFGNINQAAQMSAAMQKGIIADQIEAEAQKASDPIAKFQGMQAAAKFRMENVQTIQSLATQKLLMDRMGQQQSGQDNTPQMIQMLRIRGNEPMAKSLEERYVPGIGTGSVPIPQADRGKLIGMQNVDNALAKLEDFAQKNAGSLDPAIINQGKTMASYAQDQLRRATAGGVFREAEKEFIGSMVDQDPTKFFSSFRTQPKYSALRNSLRDEMNGIKQGYGLPTPFQPKSMKAYNGK